MKSLIAGLFCMMLMASTTVAQHAPLQIEGINGNFYLVHIVVAKDNWYSIGRLYNASPHDIATYNSMGFDRTLEIGQQINIPLTSANFDQKQKKTSAETLIPVYHTVQDKEWAFRLSSIYNDVPVTSLEKWNKIKRDDLKEGMPVIVGFLKVKSDQSQFASVPPASPGAGKMESIAEKSVDSKIIDQPAQTVTTSQTKIVSSPTVSASSNSSSTERVNSYAASHAAGGFFSFNYLGNSNRSVNGQAGTFKSTSGWTDGKYYALINGVPVGTIVRISSNGRSVYAKVLGQLPEMKESNGLITRISSAASAELGTGEGRFVVEIKY